MQSCREFNLMYNLPVADVPTLRKIGPLTKRLKDFKKTLSEEVDEIDDIVEGGEEIDILVQIADLLGDICIYCFSESAKYGIPLDEVILDAIVASNLSKKNEDGSVSYNEQGKLLKGNLFFPPEPKIKEILKLAQKVKKEKVNESAKYFENSQESAS